MQWVKYSERKPDSAGVYMWRMGSRKVKGLIVIARAKFRLRGAGYEDVLSPEFDRWDGYSVIVPGELQWAEDDGSLPDISFENLPDATECPFCKRQPVIKAFEWNRGCRIAPEPYILNQFQLKWHTEFGHLNRGDMLTSEQHRCSNEKKKFQRRV